MFNAKENRSGLVPLINCWPKTFRKKITAMKKNRFLFTLCMVMLIALDAPPLFAVAQETVQVWEIGLNEAIQEAMNYNHRRPVSRLAVSIAEARHRQALAAYWPQLTARAHYLRMDEIINFITPGGSSTFSAQSIPVPPGTSTTLDTPAGPYTTAQVSIPGQKIMSLSPDFRFMDEESVLASLQTKWLLYGGGAIFTVEIPVQPGEN
ncbi:MAG: hypothetical protein CR981_02110 [Proteobacteria bacterium]|nr:MAG: hypothetical protein CR981_02110 [Pseudomonadota bacterium]